MFTWTTGWHPVQPNVDSGPQARGLKQLPHQVGTIWSSDHVTRPIRQVASGPTTLTVIGPCFATHGELQAALTAVANSNWAQLANWPGAYLVIARHHNRTVVFGNLMGSVSVYYAPCIDGVLWATATMPLAAYLGATPNLQLLTAELGINGIQPYGGKAPYTGVHAVPPGCLLDITRGTCQVSRWYVEANSLEFDEAAECLRAALLQSIDERVAQLGRLSGDLSGGFDSSSLMALAARSQRVTGFTYIDPTMVTDDLWYAQQVAAQTDIEHRLIQGGKEPGWFAGLHEQLPSTDLPSLDAAMPTSHQAFVSHILNSASNHHLTGDAGDAVLCAPLTRLADLFRDGQYVEATRQIRAAARRWTSSPWQLWFAAYRLGHTPYAKGLRQLAKSISRGSVDTQSPAHAMRWCSVSVATKWLTPQGFHAGAALLQHLAEQPEPPVHVGAFHTWHELRYAGLNGQAFQAVAAQQGITVHMPFGDNRVVASCLSLANHLWGSREGQFKPLLAAALQGLVPDVLWQRNTKASFSGVMTAGIRTNLPVLEELIHNSQFVQADLVQAERVMQDLQRQIRGIDTGSTGALHQLVTMEVWLRNLDLRRNTWWVR